MKTKKMQRAKKKQQPKNIKTLNPNWSCPQSTDLGCVILKDGIDSKEISLK